MIWGVLMKELKFDGRKVIISNSLRKVLLDLLEETNYSGKYEIELEFPSKKFNFYKRYPRLN
ncbi:MAG: hypothetical protein J6A04_01805 [Clostridia bacterium]|nr:hypothetical protein [Clostridia bacterium]